MDKNGQIQVQLNWIFVLIAGAIILTFFVSMILVFKGGSEEQLNYKVLTKLDTLFTGAGVSIGTSSLIEIPKANIEFDCEAFRISQAKVDFGKQLVFAPSMLEGDRLLTFTKDWSVPFRIDNFLYITSPRIAYYFVNVGEGLLKDLPPKLMSVNNQEEVAFNHFFVEPGDIKNISYIGSPRVKFIFLGSDPEGVDLSSFKKLEDAEVNAVAFDYVSGKGEVRFYQKDSENNTFKYVNSSVYVGTAALYGAIFTDTVGDYNCVMSKAFQRLNKVARVYQLRTELLWTDPIYSGTGCQSHYDTAYFGPLVGDFSFFNAADYNVDELILQNKKLLEKACALMY